MPISLVILVISIQDLYISKYKYTINTIIIFEIPITTGLIMKHYRVKSLLCCTSFASTPETVLLVLCMPCIPATDLKYSNHKNMHYVLLCNCNRPRVCQVSIQNYVVHTKKSRSLADSLECSVMSQSSYRTYR